MDKSKLVSLGERLKTQGAQVGRMMSTKMKDLLQAPTPESKMVDEATLETLPEPNWGLNLRICAMVNAEEFSGTEVVRAIKRKMSGKSAVAQRLSLELLETCAMNCDKVFSEVASEKVLEEMVRMIDNPIVDAQIRRRFWELIRAWGESQDLAYLPVFRQTYMGLKARGTPPPLEDGNSLPMEYSLESSFQQPLSPPGGYPIINGSLPTAEKKECLVLTRNSLEVLSSMLSSGADRNSIKDELVMSMVEKCKNLLPDLHQIIHDPNNDEGLLFEALNIHDEMQQVISRFEGLTAGDEQPNSGSDSVLQSRESEAQPKDGSTDLNVYKPDVGSEIRLPEASRGGWKQ